MTPDDIKKSIAEILTEHDHAIGAIRQANEDMRRVTESLKDANEAMRRAIERHDEAIVSALLANRAAIQLLNRMDT